VPLNSYNITINHNIILDVSVVISSAGGLTVSSTGTLMQDGSLNRDISVIGAATLFDNNGTCSFRNFNYSGHGQNLGTLNVVLFLNTNALFNPGNIVADSLNFGSNVFNTSTGNISGNSFFNAGDLTNQGRINIAETTNNGTINSGNYFESNSFINNGTYSNTDSLVINSNFFNASSFDNQGGSVLRILNDFYNSNPSNTATFNNSGYVEILNNFDNEDNISGNSGQFNVSNNSINNGSFSGQFQFCDLTPPPNAPFVDVNTGTIDPNIYWCTAVGLNNYSINNEVSVFPNPNSGSFVITSNSLESFNLIDELGRIVSTITLNENNNFKKEIKFLQNGVYYLKSLTKNSCDKIVVTQ